MLQLIGKSLTWGMASSVALVALALALIFAGIPHLMMALMMSGFPLASLIPQEFMYWLFPHGGRGPAMGVMLSISMVQLTFIFALVAFMFLRRRPSNNSFKADSQPLRGRERP